MAIQAWHIMKEKVSVGPETTVKEAALRMISSGLPAVPVVKDGMEVAGLVTENAILGVIQQGLDLEQVGAAAVMVKPPLTCDITTTADQLIQTMLKHNCCSMIVILNNNKYAGVITRHMLMDIQTSPHYARFAQKDRKAPFMC